jgi:RNA polymerase sigma-70 factor, ECF subfamily
VTPQERAELHTLMKRLAGGDRTAIAQAFATLWPVLRSFARCALGNDADAEDAAQVTAMKLFAQVADFDPQRSDAVGWALTIASFECRTIRRQRHRRREIADADALLLPIADDTSGTPESLAIERDLDAAVRQVLKDLKPEDAETIFASIASTRPTNDATFRKRLQRALARLRLAWKAKHETP